MIPDNFIQAKIATILSDPMNWKSIKDYPMMNLPDSVFICLEVYNTNCIFKCAESAFKYLQWLMPIHYQHALDIKRILISNRYKSVAAI